MNKRQFAIAFLSMLAAAGTISTAEARSRSFQHSYSRSVQGPNGRGFHHDYNASRGGGQAAMSRNIQTNDGRGLSSQRGYQVQDGQFHGATSHVTNSGKSWGRSTSAVANGDGTATYQRDITGPNGGSASRSGTIGGGPR